MYFTIIIILSSVLIPSANGKLQQRPMLFIHGLNDSCTSFSKRYKIKELVCIESGAGMDSFRSLGNQIDTACKGIYDFIELQRKNIDIYKIGFYLVAFSQGGLIARGVFHECKALRPLIKGLFMIGTPNLGIDKFPQKLNETVNISWYQKSFNYMVKLLFVGVSKDSWWAPLNTGPFEYVNKFKSMSKASVENNNTVKFDSATPPYKKYTNFKEVVEVHGKPGKVLIKRPNAYLRYLNEGITEGYYDNLDLMINFTFLDDEMIDPIPSQSFGAMFDEEEDRVQDFRETQAYNEDYMGLRSLYDESKLINCAMGGKHLSFKTTDFENLMKILSVEECDHINPKDPIDLQYRKCQEYMLKSYTFLSLYKCNRALRKRRRKKRIFDNMPELNKKEQYPVKSYPNYSQLGREERRKIML